MLSNLSFSKFVLKIFWFEQHIKFKLILSDIAATSIDQCKERYSKLERDRKRGYSRDRVFTTEFFAADCTKVRILMKI